MNTVITLLAGLLCPHTQTILRRKDGRMGSECRRCFLWLGPLNGPAGVFFEKNSHTGFPISEPVEKRIA